MRDITLADTFYVMFTTRAFATGAPTTLAGTPVVSAYEDNSVTQITAGVSLSVDFDSVTGLNLVTVVATGANGFESGKSYHLVITTGTVDSVSVVGEVVGEFTIESSAAAVDLANGTDGLGAIKAETAAILNDTDLIDDGTSGLAKIATDVAAILIDTGTTLDAALAVVDANVDAILVDTGTTLPATLGTPGNLGGGATLADNLSDMAGATFSTTTDSQEAIRDRGDAAWTTGAGSGLTPIASGTAQGGSASTIQLAAGETFGDDILNGNVVKITSGTGAGQARVITDYTGATDTATVTPNWITNPDATSVYEVVEGSANVTAIEGSDPTDQINAAADTAIADAALATAAALATVDANVDAILLDTAEIGAAGAGLTEAGGTGDQLTAITSVIPTAAAVADAVTDEALSGHQTVGTVGHALTLAAYAGPYGPGVYIDDGAANTNTTAGADGTAKQPVSTLTAARTLADALGIKRYYFYASDLTLGATHEDWQFIGIGEVTANIINLGSQDVDRSTFMNLTIEGTQGGTQRIQAIDCALQDPGAGATTLNIFALRCGIVDQIEIDTSADNVFDSCFSLVAGTAAPIVSATGAAGTVAFRHYSGGIQFNALSASHNVSVETDGQVIFNSDCNVNATVALRGNLNVVDNTAGMANLTVESAINRSAINAEADTAISDAALATAAALATVDTVVDAILVDTAEIGAAGAGLTEAGGTGDQLTAITAAISALNDIAAADVWAVVPAAASAAPVPGTDSYGTAIAWLLAKDANKLLQTATTATLRNAADSADIATASVSDDDTTFTRGAWA